MLDFKNYILPVIFASVLASHLKHYWKHHLSGSFLSVYMQKNPLDPKLADCRRIYISLARIIWFVALYRYALNKILEAKWLPSSVKFNLQFSRFRGYPEACQFLRHWATFWRMYKIWRPSSRVVREKIWMHAVGKQLTTVDVTAQFAARWGWFRP